MRRIPGFLSLSLALLLGGCLYGFSGGGLPSDIKTVAILPIENLTADPGLAQEIQRAVREAMERRLGLRQAGESTADAIVSGTITRYEPDVPVEVTSGQGNQVNVTRRRLQLSVSLQILNRRTNVPIWEQQNMLVQADYEAGNEAEGRRRALDRLTSNIVDGAQSQW